MLGTIQPSNLNYLKEVQQRRWRHKHNENHKELCLACVVLRVRNMIQISLTLVTAKETSFKLQPKIQKPTRRLSRRFSLFLGELNIKRKNLSSLQSPNK